MVLLASTSERELPVPLSEDGGRGAQEGECEGEILEGGESGGAPLGSPS